MGRILKLERGIGSVPRLSHFTCTGGDKDSHPYHHSESAPCAEPVIPGGPACSFVKQARGRTPECGSRARCDFERLNEPLGDTAGTLSLSDPGGRIGLPYPRNATSHL